MTLSPVIFLLLFFPPGFAENVPSNDLHQQLTSETNLATVRQLLIRQEVIVLGSVSDLAKRSVLSERALAGRKGTGQYMALTPDRLPAKYCGKRAKVIALQLHGLYRRPFQLNSSEKVIPDDEVVNPCVDLIVQFDDGTLALCSGYPITINNNIQLTGKGTQGEHRSR